MSRVTEFECLQQDRLTLAIKYTHNQSTVCEAFTPENTMGRCEREQETDFDMGPD